MIGTLGIFAAVPALAVFFHVFDEFHLQVLRFGLAVWVVFEMYVLQHLSSAGNQCRSPSR